MSLIGIDIGSSATKAVAWSESGQVLASQRLGVAARHPRPGLWEVEPQDVWEAAVGVLRRLAADPALRRDPAQALAVSASGREVFLADADGAPLTPCVMAADVRGEAVARRLTAHATAEEWVDTCGHLPERMDPAVRMLWWRMEAPEIARRAARVLGWHELLTLRLTGVAACDPSLASRWLTYDVSTGGWSSQAMAELQLDPASLPQILSWGAIVGELTGAAAAGTGLPAGLPVATGAFDVCCAALGLGTQPHEISVACGTWQAAVVPIAATPAADTVLAASCTTGAHPGPGGLGVFSLNPDSGSVLDWAGRLTGVSIGDIESELRDGGPSPVSAIPWLAEGANGALGELSLAATAPDIVSAIAEAIVYELVLRVETLAARGIPVDRMRATGGGARSRWWMQLFADLLGRPVHVGEPEAGSLGAALLAGVAVGAYASMADARRAAPILRSFEPSAKRSVRHAERLAHYEDVRRGARHRAAASL